MRLINTLTCEPQIFFAKAVPDYAILSHRWDENEVSLQDLQDGKAERMSGYSKIKRCCVQAQLDGLQYVWIDSCCIDKTSSAELSEAINSMYQWYKQSVLCYAYLGDVRGGNNLHRSLRKSNWFTRGWTLQELLAPSTLVFFDQNWKDIGTKGSLEEVISEITGINDFINFETACVAQKMSWASQRETTRVEDMAYCLLGLFNVNMPPLYGEGEKAFMRLQMEILKTSDDESIFAWYEDDIQPGDLSGLLASSPRQFKQSKNIRVPERKSHGDHNFPFSMTSKGLYISLRLLPSRVSFQFITPLNCSWVSDTNDFGGYLVIIIQRDFVNGLEQYSRALDEKLVYLSYEELQHRVQASKESINSYIYVKEELFRDENHLWNANPFDWMSFVISTTPLEDHGFALSSYDPINSSCYWDSSQRGEMNLKIRDNAIMVTGMMFTNQQTKERIVLIIGLGKCYRPWLIVFVPEDHQDLTAIVSNINEKTSSNRKAPKFMTKTNNSVASSSSSGNGPLMEHTTPEVKERPSLDRMSRQLKDGTSISASLSKLKPDTCSVKFEVSSEGSLRWPAPVWVQELILATMVRTREAEQYNTSNSDVSRMQNYRRRTAPVASSENVDFGIRTEYDRRSEQFDPRRGLAHVRDEYMNESQRVSYPMREDPRVHPQLQRRYYNQYFDR